jgi:hypothetical protein
MSQDTESASSPGGRIILAPHQKQRRQRFIESLRTQHAQHETAHSELSIAPVRPVPSLHDPRNGRLRADFVTKWFEMLPDEMAQLLGITVNEMQRAPGASRLQAQLTTLEAIAAALSVLVGEESGRAWLNLPDDQLDGQTPLRAIKEGNAHIVAEMLADMLWGQPS